MHEHRELLADGRRGRRLPVGAGEHRVGPVRDGALREAVDDVLERREPHPLHRRADGERVGEVVDVLARAGEVGEFGDGVEAEAREPGPHVVFDGLDVVPGRRLEARELVDVGLAEVGDEGPQAGGLLGGEPRRSEQFAVGEEYEPLDFHVDPGPVESRLGEVLAEFGHGGPVAPVERAEGLDGQCHGVPNRIPGLIWRNKAALARSTMLSTVSKSASSA